jgi:hypothetical protein
MPRHNAGLLMLLLLSGWGDCHDNTQVCVPRTTASCDCATGDLGEKVCSPSGEDYGDCACLPDAGVDAGEPDADALDDLRQ